MKLYIRFQILLAVIALKNGSDSYFHGQTSWRLHPLDLTQTWKSSNVKNKQDCAVSVLLVVTLCHWVSSCRCFGRWQCCITLLQWRKRHFNPCKERELPAERFIVTDPIRLNYSAALLWEVQISRTRLLTKIYIAREAWVFGGKKKKPNSLFAYKTVSPVLFHALPQLLICVLY